jgi:hypothetical protein
MLKINIIAALPKILHHHNSYNGKDIASPY